MRAGDWARWVQRSSTTWKSLSLASPKKARPTFHQNHHTLRSGPRQTRQNGTTNHPAEAARSVFGISATDYGLADRLLSELQLQYSNYKNGLQQIAQKIGDVEQEAEEHKFVITPYLPKLNNAPTSRPGPHSPVQVVNTPLEYYSPLVSPQTRPRDSRAALGRAKVLPDDKWSSG